MELPAHVSTRVRARSLFPRKNATWNFFTLFKLCVSTIERISLQSVVSQWWIAATREKLTTAGSFCDPLEISSRAPRFSTNATVASRWSALTPSRVQQRERGQTQNRRVEVICQSETDGSNCRAYFRRIDTMIYRFVVDCCSKISGVTDKGDTVRTVSPGKLNVKTGPALSLCFGI